MKKFRKFLAAVLVAVMMLSLGSGMVNTEAQAAGTGSIKISAVNKGETYKAYRIFDLEKSTDNTSVSYRLTDKWKPFFTAPGGAGSQYLKDTNSGGLNTVLFDNKIKYIDITDTTKAEFVKAARTFAETIASDDANDGTVADSTTSVTLSKLPFGYYLVFDVNAADSICSLLNVDGAEDVFSKGKTPSIDKTVDDPDKTVEVSQVVTYTITGKVPNTTGYKDYKYIVRDTMKGLALTGEYTVTIGGELVASDQQPSGDVTGADTDPVAPLPSQGNSNFGMSIAMKNYQTKVGQPVIITYKAVVLESAIKGGTDTGGNPNKATLEYTNNPSTGDTVNTDKTPAVVPVYTFEVKVDKYKEGAKTEKLADAVFALYKEDQGTRKYYHETTDKTTGKKKIEWVELKPGESAETAQNITRVTTTAEGVAKFSGLAEGTYKLQEVKAPKGYNLMAQDQAITVNKDKTQADFTIEVPNSTGTELPGTGGIGNTIFYIVGGALILAGVVLLMRKRAK
ncbi:MAG: SpaH/EbpB family LPXTG-anchored major pilin [Peptococcaceae bacterium]